MKTQEMFLHGPVFWPTSKNASIPIRESILTGDYTVSLGSMTEGSDVSHWPHINNPLEVDNDFGRELLLGFSPEEELHDNLSMRPELEGEESAEKRVRVGKLYCACFTLNGVWCKQGYTLEPLPLPLDDDGNTLFHGAILNFKNIPPIYHLYD